jgi:hypothetical protein
LHTVPRHSVNLSENSNKENETAYYNLPSLSNLSLSVIDLNQESQKDSDTSSSKLELGDDYENMNYMNYNFDIDSEEPESRSILQEAQSIENSDDNALNKKAKMRLNLIDELANTVVFTFYSNINIFYFYTEYQFRSNVTNEILVTEKNYVKHLKHIIEVLFFTIKQYKCTV